MIKTKKITVEKVIATSIKCDKCGKEYSYDLGTEDGMEAREFSRVRYCGGYANTTFGDMTRVEYDICQYCFYSLVKDFARINDEDAF